MKDDRLKEIALDCHRRIWPRCPEDERGPDVAMILATLREVAAEAVREEREALRKRHIFGDEESGQAVYVEWRGRRYGKGPVLWAVTRLNSCLNKSGEWEYEPQPSSRDDAFIARCRWTSLDEALAAARSRAEEPKP